ncbi:membrane lipoprotein lipid attachment site-containing protein (plasmid) [Vibrio sp. SS-MA-C1-2]|uniref:membrane lipoprotein lipid attachment site-containing protein n=1 Tax=Vibrio sp. SS-MA-C1-2 TaxID=2908646 RepID=UPI001F33B62A|nr:membrane lipoprotein lipid attachment site-containing protein [Vibrio sp. SS-MA-C1-2]UJF20328.1 membrane lipoprotein lipid attachment site-containing protein [Vibrio sp. SS-MA-C1-2]
MKKSIFVISLTLLLTACSSTSDKNTITGDESMAMKVAKSAFAAHCFQDASAPKSTVNDIGGLGYTANIASGVAFLNNGWLLGLNNALSADDKCGTKTGLHVAYLDADVWADKPNDEISQYLFDTMVALNPVTDEMKQRANKELGYEFVSDELKFVGNKKWGLIEGYEVVVPKSNPLRNKRVPDISYYNGKTYFVYDMLISATVKKQLIVNTELNSLLQIKNILPVRFHFSYSLSGTNTKERHLDLNYPKNIAYIMPYQFASFNASREYKLYYPKVSSVRFMDEIYFFVKPIDGKEVKVPYDSPELDRYYKPK